MHNSIARRMVHSLSLLRRSHLVYKAKRRLIRLGSLGGLTDGPARAQVDASTLQYVGDEVSVSEKSKSIGAHLLRCQVHALDRKQSIAHQCIVIFGLLVYSLKRLTARSVPPSIYLDV